MKIRQLSLTAAIVSCSAVCSFAQIQIIDEPVRPKLAPSLVSGQLEGDTEASLIPTAKEVADNPFDFLDSSAFDAPVAEAQELGEESEDFSPSDNDPTSLPVGRRHRNRSVVETIVDHSVVQSVPNASFAPVQWNYGQSYNPTAHVLLREQCVEGLWATYPAQRAAECAAMWNRIHGHHHGHGCNSCNNGCTNCPTAVNRYTQRSGGCDACTTGCDSCNGGFAQLPAPPVTQTVSESVEATPVAKAQDNKVALLPQLLVR